MLQKTKLFYVLILVGIGVLLSSFANASATQQNLIANAIDSITPGSMSLADKSMLKQYSVDRNFQLQVKILNENTLIATWNIKPGNYLYLKNFSFYSLTPQQVNIQKVIFPKTYNIKNDPFYGRIKIYKDSVAIKLKISRSNKTINKLPLVIAYQGCSESGICFAPIQQKFNLDLSSTNKIYEGEEYFGQLPKELQKKLDVTHSNIGDSDYTSFLSHTNIVWAFLIFFGLGLLLTFTPCVLPLLPIISSIVTGQKQLTTTKAFSISLSYVLGMAISYAVVGVLAGIFGGGIQNILQTPWTIGAIALLFVVMAVAMFGVFELKIPSFILSSVNNLSSKQKSGTYIGVFIMGILSTLIVSTCVTAPLVAVLAYISYSGNAVYGGLILFAMGLGMGVPILIVGTTSGSILPKAGNWMHTVKHISGFMLLGLAIYMLSKIIPARLTLLLTGILILSLAVYSGAFSFYIKTASAKVRQLFAYIFLIYGSTLLIGFLMGNTSIIEPLGATTAQINQPQLEFEQVTNSKQLHRALEKVKKQGKPVIVDYYANWCLDCQYMKHTTFADPKVINKLKNYKLIQANVTDVGQDSSKLLKEFNLFGPPSVIIFDQKGHKEKSIVGKVNAKELLSSI
ncbi:protein-disulfide reductase DsbD [Francisella salina]|uniref:Cytochrome c-type biogenesis protein DsbD, protein-disulfide reductase n=1 Tax=Francisella salina TaxID=573569 RepID=A0ABN3ZMI6_FRAST|nr:protein-disulfide reductase DsbD [Francisella salina]AEI36153.1 Cytochrome c-type biogenesis protein DsbD, protein-disulfide reductase [Francisella salina]